MPSFVGSSSGAARRTLVETASGGQLWQLDFERGKAEVVIEELDFSGSLSLDDVHGDRALVSCLGENGGAHLSPPTARPCHHDLTELVELRGRQRYRSSLAFEVRFAESGLALARRPGGSVELVVIEPR